MKQAITMPALSDTMNNGRLVKWLRQPGDHVKTGEAIAEVETDKAIMEVEAFHDGYLAGPLAKVDQELPIGDTIGYIADSAVEAMSASPSNKPVAAGAAPPPRETVSAKPASAPPPPPASASPILAAASTNRPTAGGWHAHHAPARSPRGPDSPPPNSDVPVQPNVSPVAPPPSFLAEGPAYRIERNSSLREAVARAMIASTATPAFRVTALLPLTPLQATAHDNKISLTLLLARACARTIKAHSLFNAVYTENGLARRDQIDIGIAVDSPEGLITPVLRDVAGRSLAALSADWEILREKVKSRRLVPSDYRGATFYLSDLGVFPVVYAFDSLIPIGASAILSIAANRDDGAFCTLNCDHRVVFGGDAARFLETLAAIIKEPTKLIEEDAKP